MFQLNSKSLIILNIIFIIIFIVSLYDRYKNGKYYHMKKLNNKQLNINSKKFEKYKKITNKLIEEHEINKSKDLFNNLTKLSAKSFLTGCIYGLLFSGSFTDSLFRGISYSVTVPIMEYFFGN